MNPIDIILILVLAAVLSAAVAACVKNRKRGGCGCPGNCSDCSAGCVNKNN